MLFKKKNHLVGLDIGSRTIKVGELVETKKGMVLNNFGMLEIPSGLIEEGAIRNPEAVSDAIRTLFTTCKIKEQNVAVSIGGYSVIVKPINVDTMSDEELHETIHIEAEQYIPFDINDVNLDFYTLGESQTDPNKISVLLVAAKKELINGYVDLIRMADLNPCIIDVDAFALQNIFEMNYDTSDESVALIDIGASKTALNIIKDNTSVFTRDVPLGCGQIDEKIITLLDCEHEEAERIKKEGQADNISTGDLKEIISSVVEDWSIEIRRALDFFYSTYPDDQINRIFLSGGGAHVKDFRHLLSQDATADVEVLNPFNHIEINRDRIDSVYLETIAPQATICMGLSLRRVDDK